MDWLFLALLGIIWAVCVFPRDRGRSPAGSVDEFERGLGLLADTGRTNGRWIVAPRKGAQFLGGRERARARARARRRRVVVFLLEAMGLTFLMGLFPPLRPMWDATAVFFAMFGLYVVLLLSLSRSDREIRADRERFHAAIEEPRAKSAPRAVGNGRHRGLAERHVPIGRGRSARPAYNGLSVIDLEEVHVVVRSSRELQPAAR